MVTQVTPASLLASLKKDCGVRAAFAVCRSCYVRGFQDKPCCVHTESLCALKGCENDSAYLVVSSPFEIHQ